MRVNLKCICYLSFIGLAIGCSKADEEIVNLEDNNGVEIQEFGSTSSAFDNSNFYIPPAESVRKVAFTGTSTADINRAISTNSRTTGNGVILEIPRRTYNWSRVNLKTNVHLEIEGGTVIKMSGTQAGVFNIGASKNGSRLKNVSIYGKDESKFTVDLSALELTNKNVYAVKIGRVDNFRVADFNIEDRRSSVNSIVLVHVPGASEDRPGPADGVLENISQSGAHTGYGLVQTYNADHILFKKLSCDGGVTLRMETDDIFMKSDLKDGSKEGGIKDIFAYDISNRNGLAAVMFSPHFVENGKVTISKVKAKGSTFAVRVEKGFLELFDLTDRFPLTTAGQNQFKQFIEDQFSITGTALSGNPYKRNNGRQWATRLSTEASIAPRNPYVKSQLGDGLKAGSFISSSVKNVTAIYENDKGAKIKQGHLKYIPCSVWESGLINPRTSLDMFNGFEYHGPSVSLSIDNTTGTTGGSYKVDLIGSQRFNGFPAGFIENIKASTAATCSINVGTITSYTASF